MTTDNTIKTDETKKIEANTGAIKTLIKSEGWKILCGIWKTEEDLLTEELLSDKNIEIKIEERKTMTLKRNLLIEIVKSPDEYIKKYKPGFKDNIMEDVYGFGDEKKEE